MMKIGITGHNGRLGSQLVKMGCDPLDCDINDEAEVTETIQTVDPDVIIHCAAWTDVDGCEKDVEKALRINMRGLDTVRCAFKGRMIYISTDYIFNGHRGPYGEDAKADPINNYGFTKWAGEMILNSPWHEGDVVVRTTGLYGAATEKTDFLKHVMLTLFRGETFCANRRLYGNQTYVPHLAEALIKLAMLDKAPRVVNIGSSDVVSRYEFARMIAKAFDYPEWRIEPVDEVDGWIAKRPIHGGLRTGLARKIGLPIYSIESGLAELAYP